MHDKVKKAIYEVDKIIFEVDLFKPKNTALMQQKMMTPVPNFLSSLKHEQIHLIDSTLSTINQNV